MYPQSTMKHLKRIAFISFIAATVIVLTLLTAIQFPTVQRSIVNNVFRHFGGKLGFQIHIDTLAINWFKGTVSVENLRMTPVPLNTPADISVDKLWLDLGIRDYFQGKTTIQSLIVTKPKVLLEQHPDGMISLPWNFPSAEQTEPEDTDNTKLFDFLDNLRIKTVQLENGHFEVFQRDQDSPPIEIDGLSVSLSTQPRLSNLNALIQIETAHWLNPSSGETISLTKPLILDLHSDMEPIELSLQTEIETYPITLNGHFLPFADTLTYTLSLHGAGPIDAILTAFAIEEIAVPELEVSIDANSNETTVPDLAFAVQSPSLTIGPTLFDAFKLTGILSGETVHADLVADTKPGHAALSVTSDTFPAFDSWKSTVTFQRFPLNMLAPWIPDIIDLQGFIDGSIHAENASSEWMDTIASGSLAILKSSEPPLTEHSAYHLRPEGRLELKLDNRKLTLSNLTLMDTSLQTKANGYWNIPDETWSVNFSLLSDNIEPWATMAGISAAGEIDLAGQFAHPKPDRDITGTASLQIKNAQYQDHAIPIVDLLIDIDESRLSADIKGIQFDDLALSGTLAGELDILNGKIHEILFNVDSLKWRDDLEQSLAIAFKQKPHEQNIYLVNEDSTLKAEFIFPDDGAWNGACELDAFSLGWIAPVLPEPLNTLTGTLSCRLDIDNPTLNGDPRIALYLEQISAEIQEKHIQTARPAHIVWQDQNLSIDDLTLEAEDGSRVAVNGAWSTNNTEDSAVRCELSIPNIGYWPIPGDFDTISGSLSADVNIRNSLGTIIPEGSISIAELHLDSMELIELTARMNPSDSVGGLTLELDLNGFRAGTDDLAPQISSSGALFIAPGYEDIEHLNVKADLDELVVALKNLEYTNDEKISIEFSDDTIQINTFRLKGPETIFEVNGSIALNEEAADPGNINVVFQTSLQSLTNLGPDMGVFAGRLDADFNLAGPLSVPHITGKMNLNDIAWDNPDLPGPIQHVNGAILLTDEHISFQNVSGFFGGGKIDLVGFIDREGFELGKTDITLRARELDLDIMPELHMRAMADTSLKGTWPDVTIGGQIRITEMLYTPELDLMDLLANLAKPQVIISEDTEEADTLGGFPLDLTVLAQDNIRIENSHLNLVMTARFQITGTTAVPGVWGSVSLESGLIDLLLHEFEITSGTLNFTQPFEINPSIDITAETRVQNDIVRFKITGFADRPNLLLSSESGKSHAEIMALLLGQDLSSGDGDLTTMALDYAKQAAARAAAQAIGARTDLIIVPFPNKLENENLLVGVGRHLGEKWSVMYYFAEKSEEGNVIEVEYLMNPKTNLNVRQNQDGSLSGGVRYRETFN